MTYDDKAFTVFAAIIVTAYLLALYRMVKARLKPKPSSAADDLMDGVYHPMCRCITEKLFPKAGPEEVDWIEAFGTKKVITLQKCFGSDWTTYANERIWVPKRRRNRIEPLKIRTDLNNGRADA